jgi:hypothetical protein
MFQTSSRSTVSYERPANLDLDERYIFKLVKLEDEGVSKFADPTEEKPFHNIRWDFNVAHADSKTPIFGSDGNPWVFSDYTTSKTGRNPKNGQVAKARVWIEALLGKQIESDEITADMPSKIIGKYAAGFFEEKDRESQDGAAYKRLVIMRLTPYKPGEKPEPKPEPKPTEAPPDLPF